MYSCSKVFIQYQHLHFASSFSIPIFQISTLQGMINFQCFTNVVLAMFFFQGTSICMFQMQMYLAMKLLLHRVQGKVINRNVVLL